MSKFWSTLLLSLTLLTPGCVVVTDDSYQDHCIYQYEGIIVGECHWCHHYHTGPCASPVIVTYCISCGHYHTGRCHPVWIRRYRHYH